MRKLVDFHAEQDLERLIAAFEATQHEDGGADLAKFLPDRNDPVYLAVLRELVRVDLEYMWTRGQCRRVDYYRRKFPELFEDLHNVQAICFEEFRLRHQAGEDVSAEEYQRNYGVDTRSWAVLPQPGGSIDLDFGRGNDLGSSHRPSIFSSRSSAAANGRSQVLTVPKTGETLLGFELVDVLGRGTFATVFLARQGNLADRFVALKVSQTRLEESGILARLQHTNIVPIYSVHRHGPFQVICMPFFGSTTLAELIRDLRGRHCLPASGQALVETLCLRNAGTCRKNRDVQPVAETPIAAAVPADTLNSWSPSREKSIHAANDTLAIFPPAAAMCLKALSGMTYVEAVLWIGSRLAAGLHHAHERGILHRDLKPANVLLADDGQPMLLDFNLSEDVRPVGEKGTVPICRNGPKGALHEWGPSPFLPRAEFIGGTLPYIATENLLAYQCGTTGRRRASDVYSLGVILYELLTGRLPFSAYRGPEPEVLSRMLADRQNSAPGLRPWNKAVSPAVEAIVKKCLAADPQCRYASADELRDDMERQLKHQPLRYAPEPSWRERAHKWVRRHPRLTSASSIAAVASVFVALLAGGLAYRGAHFGAFRSRRKPRPIPK